MTLQMPTFNHWPYNAIESIVDALQEIDPHTNPTDRDGLRIYRRRLHDGDDTQSLGIYPTTWEPDMDTVEFRGRPGAMATLQRYPIEIQSWTTNMDEMDGIKMHSYLASLVRETLVSSALLDRELPQLRVTLLGSGIESYVRHAVTGQTYLSAELGSNTFGFLATTQLYVDSQIN